MSEGNCPSVHPSHTLFYSELHKYKLLDCWQNNCRSSSNREHSEGRSFALQNTDCIDYQICPPTLTIWYYSNWNDHSFLLRLTMACIRNEETHIQCIFSCVRDIIVKYCFPFDFEIEENTFSLLWEILSKTSYPALSVMLRAQFRWASHTLHGCSIGSLTFNQLFFHNSWPLD